MDSKLRDLLIADFEATAALCAGPIVVDNPPELLEAIENLEAVQLAHGQLLP